MDEKDIIRAQYNKHDQRSRLGMSQRYDYQTCLTEDPDGVPAFRLTIVDKVTGEVIDDSYYYSQETLEDAIEDWQLQLNLRSASLGMYTHAMGGKVS